MGPNTAKSDAGQAPGHVSPGMELSPHSRDLLSHGSPQGRSFAHRRAEIRAAAEVPNCVQSTGRAGLNPGHHLTAVWQQLRQALHSTDLMYHGE